jgi:hypothetical protein
MVSKQGYCEFSRFTKDSQIGLQFLNGNPFPLVLFLKLKCFLLFTIMPLLLIA